jgi:hypothetical protein
MDLSEDEPPSGERICRESFLSPLPGLAGVFTLFPTADAVGYLLSLLRSFFYRAKICLGKGACHVRRR